MKSLEYLIREGMVPHIKHYFGLVHQYKGDFVLDGVKAFNEKSQFVEGKVVNAFSYYVVEAAEENEKEELLIRLKEIVDFVSQNKFETWGMLNCIIGIYRLKTKGLIEKAVSNEALALLKVKLDFRDFVNTEDLSLINKPTNYYGVAFGVARYRELLGWEDEGFSQILLDKLLKHIDMYSGELSYMDETPGFGRFDRYSVLIPAEICALLKETKMDIPEKLLVMLRKSSEIYLSIANKGGHGFSYGRSIGTYGDTAALEVLSIAACLNILSKEEKEVSYAYNTRTVDKFINFWIDKDMKSINMWEKGRGTDEYRNKNRILGENLSLAMQIINSYGHWMEAGYSEKPINESLLDRINIEQKANLYTFAKNEFTRAMVTVRDKEHIFMLPFVNGAKPYYNTTPYLPIPTENQVLESSADSVHANLVPLITLENGSKVMPISYFNEVNLTTEESSHKVKHTVEYALNKLCLVGGQDSEKYDGLKCSGIYSFESGTIYKEEVISVNKVEDLNIEKIEMEFATFSSEPVVEGSRVVFIEGIIREVEAYGFDQVEVIEIRGDETYNTPHGALKYVVKWSKSKVKLSCENNLKITWKVKYR